MKCEELLALVNEYVDGEVDPDLCEAFEKHLQNCDPCRVVVDTIRQTITLYQDDQVYEMPVGFRQRLHETMRHRWKELGRDDRVDGARPGESAGGDEDARGTKHD